MYENDLKINELTKEGVHLPIVKSGKEYSFNKHHLPFIPSLHYENEFDNKVVLEIEQSSTPPTFILKSSSGIGKTSLMIRTLCKYPGIFITGTAAFENGGTIDVASRKLMQQLSPSPSRSFATVRQLCHLLIISKILHIIYLIDLVISDNKLLDSFEGNLFSFLAFNQFGYQNTMNDYLIFDQLLKYEWCEIDDLRKLTIQSVNFLKQKLSNLSIYNSNNLDKLLICIDEANVFEEYSPIKFISSGGNEKGFLNVLTYEIELLKKESFNSSFYAGTSFSVDISNIVQSVQKTESNIINLAQFPKLDKIEFFNYVSKHIVLDSETRESIEKENTFPLRIRSCSYFLEKYINAKLNRFSTDYIFETCFDDAFDYVKKKIEKFIERRNKKEHSTSIKDTLFNYILHFRFGTQFGTNFIEHDLEIASVLLTSGLTNPTNSLDSFEANDYLGYKVALEIVGMWDDRELTVMKLARSWLSKTKDPNYIEKLTKLCSTELQL